MGTLLTLDTARARRALCALPQAEQSARAVPFLTDADLAERCASGRAELRRVTEILAPLFAEERSRLDAGPGLTLDPLTAALLAPCPEGV